jgi:hypothetical protein
MDKCTFPEGMIIKPDGVNELDPCLYEDIDQVYSEAAGILITISKCVRCGYITISWRYAKPEE